MVAAARDGDEVAGDVLRWNAEELAEIGSGSGRTAGIDQDQPFEVVMSGVLFQVSELYRQALICVGGEELGHLRLTVDCLLLHRWWGLF